MKYQDWKIKKEHHIMKEFDKFLKNLEKLESIQRIVPGRVSRKNSWQSKTFITISYFTTSWMKLSMKKGSTSQELFLIFDLKLKDDVLSAVEKIIKDFLE